MNIFTEMSVFSKYWGVINNYNFYYCAQNTNIDNNDNIIKVLKLYYF